MVDTAPEFKITDGNGPVTVDGAVGIQGQLDDVSTTVATEDNLATARITAQRALHVNLRDTAGTEFGSAANPLSVAVQVDNTTGGRSKWLGYSGYAPDPSSYPLGTTDAISDYSDQLAIRGPILTDEFSFRDDFTSLVRNLTGTPSFKGSNLSLGGSGTAYTSEVKYGQYIKKTADPETLWTQVDYVDADNSLFFATPYAGTTANVPGVVSDWKTVTPTGGSISVSSSIVDIGPGTTNGNIAAIVRQGDYLPFVLSFRVKISQRIANQTAIVGFQNDYISPTSQACLVFDGTDATRVKLRTSSSSAASDTEETTVVLASGTTATYNTYTINVSATEVSLLIDGAVVAKHNNHIPGPYDTQQIVASIRNTAAVTATTLSMDWIAWNNVNQIDVKSSFDGDPMQVEIVKGLYSTYMAAVTGLVVAANPTDIFTITGAAGKIVKVTRVEVSATQTTAAVRDILIVKRSTANSGGTSSVISGIPLDSSSSAASATVRSYTANPTLGSSLGTLLSRKLFIPTTTTVVPQVPFQYIINGDEKPITLRSASEVMAINLNAASSAGSSFNIFIEWTEE